MIDCMHIPKGLKLPSSVILVTSFSLWLAACNEAKVEITSTDSEQNASDVSSISPEIKKAKDSSEHAEHAYVRKAIPSPEALKKLPADGGSDFNRLVFEQSPYLLQHAGNPINWYPWGEEAFSKAKKENKPVFLSIGYTTCHWCHVMEHESFEDDEVAALMNKHYVCVKVDREERPDIDNVYMSVTQMMTGRGGWPMTVIMTPAKVPFFSGTYFPKQSMMQLLPHFSGIWANEREQVFKLGEAITTDLAKLSGGQPGGDLNATHLDACYRSLSSSYDPINGGFGRRPKFPTAHNLSFLLRYYARTGEAKALRMVEKSLEKIRHGGVYDHVGLGIHRYSTDERWFLPHFEKMLYDQALFAIANLECHQITKKESYAEAAKEIFTYVLRDMTDSEGGFYSAEDADSEGEEGKFYVWTTTELEKILGKEDATLYAQVYNFEADGNFFEEAANRKTGGNIPHLRQRLKDVAHELKKEIDPLKSKLEAIRKKLFEVRGKRIHPQKDDKILTDWNGLMISAFAKGGQILGDKQYIETATKAADYCLTTLRRKNGRLLKRSRLGVAGLPAHLEDYAFLIQGLLDLHESAFHHRHLIAAAELSDITLKHFEDKENGGLFLTADDGEKLLVRAKEIYDGAIPSGNSVMALNLLRIARITGSKKYEDAANNLFAAFSGFVANSPSGCDVLMTALDFAVGPSLEVVVAGKRGETATEQLLRAIHSSFLPNKVLLFRPADDEEPEIAKLAPFVQNQGLVKGKSAVYVCRNQACELPVTTVEELEKTLAKALGKEK